MVGIINDWAERGLMIHRSLAEAYEHLRDFAVAEVDGEVVGVAGLRIMWANLAELYSLALAPAARGRGLGRALVERMVADAERMQIRRVFALTYEQRFFERCGFEVVDRRTLPLKVWGECIRCPKHECCDEIAVVRTLEQVPDQGPPLPSTAEVAEYDVPMPRPVPAVLRIDRAAQATEPAAPAESNADR
jgi:amino-acid N-acetyltransferase